jgi:hypothetical protein
MQNYIVEIVDPDVKFQKEFKSNTLFQIYQTIHFFNPSRTLPWKIWENKTKGDCL